MVKKVWRTDRRTDRLNQSYSCLVAAKNVSFPFIYTQTSLIKWTCLWDKVSIKIYLPWVMDNKLYTLEIIHLIFPWCCTSRRWNQIHNILHMIKRRQKRFHLDFCRNRDKKQSRWMMMSWQLNAVCTTVPFVGGIHQSLVYTSQRGRADFRFAPSQSETALLCNDVSDWLGASLESTLQRDSNMRLLCFLWCLSVQAIEQTIELPVIWDI